MSEGDFFPRDYFLTQTTMAATIPMMLSTDIMPAGMTVPVRRNLGPKYPSNSSETINAVPSPHA